ncbi:unnamed protein product, partial [Urochloa humidicola]
PRAAAAPTEVPAFFLHREAAIAILFSYSPSRHIRSEAPRSLVAPPLRSLPLSAASASSRSLAPVSSRSPAPDAGTDGFLPGAGRF